MPILIFDVSTSLTHVVGREYAPVAICGTRIGKAANWSSQRTYISCKKCRDMKASHGAKDEEDKDE